MRYAVSGVISGQISDNTGGRQPLIGKAISTGRVFWLRSAWFYNQASEWVIKLVDQAGATATAAATGYAQASVRATIVCASGRTTLVEFPAPGLKFATGCCANFDSSGECTIGNAGGAGYEE